MIAQQIRGQDMTPLPPNFEESLKKIREDNNIPCVILNTGSYCPVHRGHLSLLIQSKNFIEQNTNYRVIAMYLSPSNDEYVGRKARRYQFEQYFLNFEQRCFLIREIIKNSNIDNIFLDTWEGSHPNFIDFPTVAKEMRNYFNTISQGIEVFLCMGQDMLKTYYDKKSLKNRNPLILVERKDEKDTDAQQRGNFYKNLNISQMQQIGVYFVPSNEKNISSTEIRNIIQQNNYNQDLIDLESLKFLREFYNQK